LNAFASRRIAMKTIVQPHASAWGYLHACTNPKLTHGANGIPRTGIETSLDVTDYLVAEFYGAGYGDGFVLEQLLEDGFAYRLVGFYYRDGFEDASFRGGGVLAA
jgi:hypothetical protein